MPHPVHLRLARPRHRHPRPRPTLRLRRALLAADPRTDEPPAAPPASRPARPRTRTAATLDVADCRRHSGSVAAKGTSSPLFRSLDRLMQFELACSPASRAYAVRRTVPPGEPSPRPAAAGIVAASARRLGSRSARDRRSSTPARRARRLAFMLFEQGDDLEQRRARAARHRLPPDDLPRERGVGARTPPRRLRRRGDAPPPARAATPRPEPRVGRCAPDSLPFRPRLRRPTRSPRRDPAPPRLGTLRVASPIEPDDDALDTIAGLAARAPRHRDPHRRGHLHRVRHPRLPRAERRVDEEPRGGEDRDAAALRVGSRGPEARVAEPAALRDVGRGAERRTPRDRRARAAGRTCTRSSPRTSTGCTLAAG